MYLVFTGPEPLCIDEIAKAAEKYFGFLPVQAMSTFESRKYNKNDYCSYANEQEFSALDAESRFIGGKTGNFNGCSFIGLLKSDAANENTGFACSVSFGEAMALKNAFGDEVKLIRIFADPETLIYRAAKQKREQDGELELDELKCIYQRMVTEYKMFETMSVCADANIPYLSFHLDDDDEPGQTDVNFILQKVERALQIPCDDRRQSA